jgi:hypothetical protein
VPGSCHERGRDRAVVCLRPYVQRVLTPTLGPGTDLRLADLPQLLVGARDQVLARRRQRDAQRAHAAYAAAVARRERARRRPQRQLWTRVGAAGGLAAAAVTVPLGIDPALWAGAGSGARRQPRWHRLPSAVAARTGESAGQMRWAAWDSNPEPAD